LLELNKVINEPQSYVYSLVNRLRKRLYQLFFDLSRIFFVFLCNVHKNTKRPLYIAYRLT